MLALVFFVSGFAGLVYETVWIREFSFILGNSVYTISTVLAAYMAGLALGSHFVGRIGNRIRRPLVVYALVEAALAIAGVLLFYLFHGSLKALAPIGILEQENLLPFLQRFGITFCVLLIPTALMGGTLPLLAKHCTHRWQTSGTVVGVLYGANTIGAAAGCFVTGFFVIRILGTESATFIASALNVFAALSALAIHFVGAAFSAGIPVQVRGEPERDGLRDYSRSVARFFLAAIFVSGMTSMSYEVLFFRMLSYFMGNRVYASAAMLAIFLGGMGLGSLLVGPFIDRGRREVMVFSFLQLVVGLFTMFIAARFLDVLDFVRLVEGWFSPRIVWHFVALRMLEAFAIIGLPAVAFGAMFPCAIRYLNRGQGGIARAAGIVYAANTAGCILGSLLTGFMVIPMLGTYKAMVVTSVISILLSYRLIHRRSLKIPLLPRLRWLGAAAAIVLATGAAGWALRHGDYPWSRPGLTRIFAYEEPASLVTVYSGPLGMYLLGDDTELSFPIGPRTSAASVQRLQAHIPMLIHPHPRRVLVIGLGFGITSGSFLTCGRVRSVETVEISEGVIKAAPLFHAYNNNVHMNPRSRLIAGDGRYYLKHLPEKYDIIASNLVAPDLPGSSSCYTKEYFELARDRLAPGGLFLLHAFGRDLKVLARTLGSVFPHILGFRAYSNTFHLVASLQPITIDPKLAADRLAAWPEMRRDLGRCGIWSAGVFMERLVLSEKDCNALIRNREVPLNTDVHPALEYGISRPRQDPFYSRISSHRTRAERAAVVTAVGDVLVYNHTVWEMYNRIRREHPDDPDRIYRYPFEAVKGLFQGIVFGNLEGPMTDVPNRLLKDKNEVFYFFQPARFVRTLQEAGFDVVSVANNHARDCGIRGLKDTIRVLNQAGLVPVGAGRNMEEARRPAIFTENGIRVAFLAYNLVPPESVWAKDNRAGTANATREEMESDVRSALKRSEAVVVSVHWGAEKVHERLLHEPEGEQVSIAHALVDAGASAVIGSHSHAVEKVERYKDGVIFYSMGNFVFTGTAKRQHRKSAIARITIARTGKVLKTELIPVNIDPLVTRYRPVPLKGAEKEKYLKRFGNYNQLSGVLTK